MFKIFEFSQGWTKKAVFYFLYFVSYILLLGFIQADTFADSYLNEFISSPPKIVFVLIIVEILMDHLLFKRKIFLFTLFYIPLLIFFAFIQRLIDNYIIIEYILTHWKRMPLLYSPAFLYNVIKLQFTIAVPFSFKLFSYWLEEKNKVQAIESEKMQAELSFLRNQFHPHFMFNVLNSLYSKILNKSDEAADIVLKISSLLRFSVYDFNTKYISLEKEIAYLKDYIALQKIRFDKRLELSFVTEGQIAGKMINPFLIIPFVENSFKYCTDSDSGEGWITIYISVTDNILSLKIENSKSILVVNEQKSSDLDASGIGLENVKRRLQLLYNENHTLKIIDYGDSFFVSLKIKLDEFTGTN